MTHPVVHFEIHGPDPAALGAFYSELFGWKVEHITDPEYIMVDNNGGAGINGGIAGNPTNAANQIFYVETADLQATIDTAKELGGALFLPIMDIPNGPTIAILKDPVGNWIGIVGEAEGDVPGPSDGGGAPVNWFEIHGAPFDAQAEFYSKLFGWEISKFEGEGFTYGEIKTGSDKGTAGAISSPSSGFTGITLWAQVDDPAAALKKAESLGGTIDMEPQTMPDGLTIANFIDPQGNRFGVHKPPGA